MRFHVKRFIAGLFLSLWASVASANVPCTLPFNLQNNTTADATQVMANYNALVACLTNAAIAGSNTDITALLGLTTPITPARGGSNVFIGGISTGSAATQAITTTIPATGFSLTAGYTVVFVWGFTTTGPLTVNVNGTGAIAVNKRTGPGFTSVSQNDGFVGTIGIVVYDGSGYELMEPFSAASLNTANQTLSGGATVTSVNLGSPGPSSTLTVNCGLGPLQFLTNTALFTLAAPGLDGACDIMLINGATANTVTQSGFTVNGNTGEPLTTTNGQRFIEHIERINGVSTFMIKALQ